MPSPHKQPSQPKELSDDSSVHRTFQRWIASSALQARVLQTAAR